ncbi:MAG: hypothetical protein R3A44_21455 [Caldilineaceae bacterium]
MKTWCQLDCETVKKIYCVPMGIADNPNNTFWGRVHSPHAPLEGSWPLIALVRDQCDRHIARLHIYSLPMEEVHDPDFDTERQFFNPLNEKDGRGSLSVDLDELQELVTIIRVQAQSVVAEKSDLLTQPVFRSLDDVEVQFYRLHPEWFQDDQIFYYIQQNLPYIETHDIVNIISISLSKKKNSKSNIHIMSFNRDDLQDQSFTPLFNSWSGIDITKYGLSELATIISNITVF